MDGHSASMQASGAHLLLTNNLRHYMNVQGLTQAELGRRAGLTQRTVANYLHPRLRQSAKQGTVAGARLEELQRISSALGMPLWEFLKPV